MTSLTFITRVLADTPSQRHPSSQETRGILPIDANAFNDLSIGVFFTHVHGCTTTQAAFTDFKLKGIFDLFDLEDLDE